MVSDLQVLYIKSKEKGVDFFFGRTEGQASAHDDRFFESRELEISGYVTIEVAWFYDMRLADLYIQQGVINELEIQHETGNTT